MKLILPLFLVLSFAGCVSNPGQSTATANVKQIAPFVTSLAQTAVPLVLNKNPQYAPIISIVATAIPTAFGTGNLDATSISQALGLIGGKAGLNSEAQAAISVILLDAVTWYQTNYSTTTASATDPNVQVLLNAFASGLQNGVILWKNSQPKTS
jgi:hypothetical protein